MRLLHCHFERMREIFPLRYASERVQKLSFSAGERKLMNRFVSKEFLRTRRGKGDGQAKALRHANNSGEITQHESFSAGRAQAGPRLSGPKKS